MNHRISLTIQTGVAFAAVCLSIAIAAAQTPTAKIVKATDAFLSTLDEKQRKDVLFAFDDAKQRTQWSNFPVMMVPRSGISFKNMTPAQHAAALAILSVALSPQGYEKVLQIMDGDEVNKTTDTGPGGPGGAGPRGGGPPGGGPPGGGGPPPGGRPGGGGGAPGGGAIFGKDLYFISFMGTPSLTAPWMIQFGGHHLALNITVAGERGILTPSLTGAQPAMYNLNGKTIRPLGRESDKGLALLNALDQTQRKQAVIGSRMADLVLGPGQDGRKIQPEGLKASAMNDKQRAMLLDVISEWAGIVQETAAAARMAQLKADINDTWFCWSGPTDGVAGKNIEAYYRIQGPHVVIEYSPQGLGGDPSLHVHAMYRDPTNDYGAAYTGK